MRYVPIGTYRVEYVVVRTDRHVAYTGEVGTGEVGTGEVGTGEVGTGEVDTGMKVRWFG